MAKILKKEYKILEEVVENNDGTLGKDYRIVVVHTKQKGIFKKRVYTEYERERIHFANEQITKTEYYLRSKKIKNKNGELKPMYDDTNDFLFDTYDMAKNFLDSIKACEKLSIRGWVINPVCILDTGDVWYWAYTPVSISEFKEYKVVHPVKTLNNLLEIIKSKESGQNVVGP